MAHRTPDGPVRRDRGVGERGRQHRVEIAQRRQLAGAVDDEVLGHATVHAESPPGPGQLGHPIADVLVAGHAVGARAAAEGSVDRDGLAHVEAGGAGAERLDPPGRLVAQRERQLGVHHPLVELVEDVEVGVADPGGAHPDQHLARSRVRLRHLLVLGRGLPCHHAIGLHGRSVT